ncbi:hypothetical protein B0H11DRAFT_2310327 [Mycena galericulata]|nr:hypothetical protein B0H11DRAFT_2310327 [Mycena galericulata]
MSSSSSGPSHSRFGSSSSSSSCSSLSDTLQPSRYPLDPYDSSQYPNLPQSQSQSQAAGFGRSFDQHSSFDHGTHDSSGPYASQCSRLDSQRPAAQYLDQSTLQDPRTPYSGFHNQRPDELQRLREQNLILRTQNAVLQQNFDSLVASMANSSSHMGPPTQARHIPPIVILKEVDFPKAKYWQKTLWTQQVDKDRGRTSISDRPVASKNSLLFITAQDGRSPTTERMSEARSCTSSLYFELKAENLLPTTWTQATHSVKNRFRAVVESEVPELRLCDNHWKADKLASITFSSWCGTHRKDMKIKSEQESDNDGVNDGGDDSGNENDAPSDEEGLKRKRHSSGSGQHERKEKKVKISNNELSSGKASKGKAKAEPRKRSKNPLFGRTPEVNMTQGSSGSPPTGVDSSEVGNSTEPAPAPAVAPAPLATSTVIPPSDSFPAVPPSVSSSIPSSTISVSSSIPSPTLSLSMPSPTLSASSSPVEMPPPPPGPPPTALSTILAAPVPSVSLPAPPPAQVSSPSTPSIVVNPAPAAVPPPAMPAPSAPSGTASKPRAWNPAATSTTMKGMCAYDYHKKHPSADRNTFEAHFKALSKDERKFWRDKENNAKAAKAQAAS